MSSTHGHRECTPPSPWPLRPAPHHPELLAALDPHCARCLHTCSDCGEQSAPCPPAPPECPLPLHHHLSAWWLLQIQRPVYFPAPLLGF